MGRYKKVRDVLGSEVFLDTFTNKEYLVDWTKGNPIWKLLKNPPIQKVFGKGNININSINKPRKFNVLVPKKKGFLR